MSQPRMNIYGFPHKGLRNLLSQLSMLSGNTDYSNSESLVKLKSLTSELVILLDLHNQAEEDFLLPALEAHVSGSTKENIEEHELIEKEVNAFDELLKNITTESTPDLGAKFYESISNFHARYIIHMAMEEGEMNSVIWANLTDEKLLELQGEIMAALSPEHTMMWFKYIVPALNPFERSIIMGSFKANAPLEFFNAVFEMLKEHLTKNELSQLKTMIG